MKIELIKINSIKQAQELIKSTGADEASIPLMDKKTVNLSFKIYSCKFYHANLLKQEAISVGADCAISKHAVTAKVKHSDCLLFGDIKRLSMLSERLKKQSFTYLNELGRTLEKFLFEYFESDYMFQANGKIYNLKDKFAVMGILNITPDSFFDGGRYNSINSALKRAEHIIEDGADIIDIGGESTRPGADTVDADEELRRVIPAIKAIREKFQDIAISIDTYKSQIAKESIDTGADIVNDISGLSFDEKMLDLLSSNNCGIIAMHIKGEPKNMQKNPQYEHIIYDINHKFSTILDKTKEYGIDEKRIVLDPGIGFGKTYPDNLKIINNISSFKIFGRPILVGASRKSFIGAILNNNPNERLYGSLAAHISAFINGASIIRTHDVKATKEALKITESILRENL